LAVPGEPYAILMAGQLSEKAGMGLHLSSHPVFQRLSGGFDAQTAGQFERWVTTASQAEISERFTAPTLMVLYDQICGEIAVREWGSPAVVAGYSLGFYAAAILARCLSAKAVIGWLTRVNASNARLFPPGDFALAVVTGLSIAEWEEYAARQPEGGLRIANINNAKQLVVAGPADQVKRALEHLEGVALDAHRLPIDIPLHTDYLEESRQEVMTWWSMVPAAAPHIPLLSPVDGQPIGSGAAFKREMLASLTAPTDWQGVIRTLEAMGIRRALDTSPGGELGRMARWTYRGLEVIPVSALPGG
jgi:malonyl CoA-acyl carrier protein transacylase